MINIFNSWPATTRRTIWVCMLGSLLEYYDFFIYALVAGVIAKQYFPEESPNLALTYSLLTLGIGYLARPLGGIIIGHYGDRLGRTTPFRYTMIVMGFSTLLIGLIPTYANIGIIAPILLVLCRLMQGMSLGGEIPGAVTYLCELLPKRRYLINGFIYAGVGSGMILATITYITILSTTSAEQFSLWGWRLLFIFGGIIGFLGYYQRRTFLESPVFTSYKNNVEKIPLMGVFKSHHQILIPSILLSALLATFHSLSIIFSQVYLAEILSFPKKDVSLGIIIREVISITTLLICAILLTKLNPHRLMKLFLLSAITLPILIFYAHSALNLLYIPMITAGCLSAFLASFIPVTIAVSFPDKVRYSGLALVYNIGSSFFGGLMPTLALLLINLTGDTLTPAYLITALAIPAFITINILLKSPYI